VTIWSIYRTWHCTPDAEEAGRWVKGSRRLRGVMAEGDEQVQRVEHDAGVDEAVAVRLAEQPHVRNLPLIHACSSEPRLSMSKDAVTTACAGGP